MAKKGIYKNGRDSVMYNKASHIYDRCNNIKSKDYKNYGGRGIECRIGNTIKEIYDNLMLVPGYFEGAQIDRTDNDGHYELGNLRWVTQRENAMNRRVSIQAVAKYENTATTTYRFNRLLKRRGLDISEFEKIYSHRVNGQTYYIFKKIANESFWRKKWQEGLTERKK